MPPDIGLRRVVLLNDTSSQNHHGCRRVVGTIRHCLAQRGLQIIASWPTGAQWSADRQFLRHLASADLVLINGEGTLHHGAARAADLLAVVEHPACQGKPVALVNTIYQDNPPDWDRWLSRMGLICARDRASQMELQRLGLGVEYAPDLSLYFETPARTGDATGTYVSYGDSVFPIVKRELQRAYLRDPRARLYLPIHTGIRNAGGATGLSLARRWGNLRGKLRARTRYLRDRGHRISDDADGFLADLRASSIHLTGRYHGICLAMSCGVPFRAVESNARKIESLLLESGLDPARLASSVAEIAETSPERWQYSAGEAASLSAFLIDGRRRTNIMFDRVAALARGHS